MLTTPHPVAFGYTRAELEALFRLTHAEDIERDGCYDARSAAINQLSHHWQHPSDPRGIGRSSGPSISTGSRHRGSTRSRPRRVLTLEDLMQVLGRLELQALGFVKHGDVPREAG